MKYSKLLVLASIVGLMGLALSHCGIENKVASGDADDGSNPDMNDNVTTEYQFSGLIFLTKEKSVTDLQTLDSSSAILSFNNASGTVTIQPTESFSSLCVRSDGDSDTSTDIPDSDTTADATSISAGTATVTDSAETSLAVIAPTTALSEVFYSPSNDILTHDLFDYGHSYTVTMAGATNADPSVEVPSFSVTLFIANPGTISIGSESVESLVINGSPLVTLADIKSGFSWNGMDNIESPAQSGVDFGIQYVQFMDADDVAKSVSCIFSPGQTTLQTALSNSASDVFDILIGSRALEILFAQVNTVNLTPQSDTSAQGFVSAYAETIQIFSEVNLVR